MYIGFITSHQLLTGTVSPCLGCRLLSCAVQVVTEAELRPVWEGRDSMLGISELDFSPDGKLLAAATSDAWIDVYNVEKGYQRIGDIPLLMLNSADGPPDNYCITHI